MELPSLRVFHDATSLLDWADNRVVLSPSQIRPWFVKAAETTDFSKDQLLLMGSEVVLWGMSVRIEEITLDADRLFVRVMRRYQSGCFGVESSPSSTGDLVRLPITDKPAAFMVMPGIVYPTGCDLIPENARVWFRMNIPYIDLPFQSLSGQPGASTAAYADARYAFRVDTAHNIAPINDAAALQAFLATAFNQTSFDANGRGTVSFFGPLAGAAPPQVDFSRYSVIGLRINLTYNPAGESRRLTLFQVRELDDQLLIFHTMSGNAECGPAPGRVAGSVIQLFLVPKTSKTASMRPWGFTSYCTS